MRKIIRFLFSAAIVAIIVYSLNDRYQIVGFLTNFDIATQEEKEEILIAQVREAMLEGKEEVKLQYVGNIENMEWFTENVIDRVYQIDDITTSSDYDYLKYKVKSIYAHIVGFGNTMTVTYEFVYNETAKETSLIDIEIKRLFDEWEIDKLNDYEKIKIIHDYIVNNASYDIDTNNYSAYDNLMNKSSTCQGYMSIAYKMYTSAGIPCRIITGIGNQDSHGWNIVKLDGKWYNIDCTWDDPLTWDGKDIIIYDYFLKSDEDFKDHTRDSEFTTVEFYEEYVMWEESYDIIIKK